MARVRHVLVVALATVACAGMEPGGGGVNLEVTTSAPTPSSVVTVSTTTTTVATTTTVPRYHISGTLTDPGGDPVVGAVVTMGDVAVESGSDGFYSLETTHPGPMTVTKRGWITVETPWDESVSFYDTRLEPITIRGIRVSEEAAADDRFFGSLITLAEQSAVNTLVFDTKEENGRVLYETSVEEAHRIGAVDPSYDPAARLAQAHEQGLYAITRIVTFEDQRRADAVPEEKLAGPWLSPLAEGARQYNVALAEEACRLGFDEVQFDYVRFPAGRTARSSGQLEMTEEERVQAVAGFLAEASDRLRPLGCAVSAAVFGIVVSVPDDQGLGQRPEQLSEQVDVLSPMVYPSHYSPGWLGYADPNAYPYDVTADAINDALPRLSPGSLLRPYLQAFWWSNDQIRSSIQAAEDLGVGWILWNVASNYDVSAIPTDEEVSP